MGKSRLTCQGCCSAGKHIIFHLNVCDWLGQGFHGYYSRRRRPCKQWCLFFRTRSQSLTSSQSIDPSLISSSSPPLQTQCLSLKALTCHLMRTLEVSQMTLKSYRSATDSALQSWVKIHSSPLNCSSQRSREYVQLQLQIIQ